MAFSDPEVTEWLADLDAANLAAVVCAERAIAQANPPQSPEESGSRKGKGVLSGDTLPPSTLRDIRQAHAGLTDDGLTAPEPMPGKRDRNWWRDLAERTTVGGCERAVLMVLVNRIWTGPDNAREGRENGRWTGFLKEIQAKCGGALSYRSAQRGIAGLMSKGIITRRIQGRRLAAGGGRGRSIYRILPANSYERR